MNAMDVCRELGVHTGRLVFEVRDQRLGQQVVRERPELAYVSSTELMALLTSQVIEHRELNAVWTELLSSGGKHGNAVLMRDMRDVVAGTGGITIEDQEGEDQERARAVSEEHEGGPGTRSTSAWSSTFNQLAEAAAMRNEVLIGYRNARGEILVNPPGKDEPLDLRSIDKLIVIARPRSFEGFV